MTEEPSVEDIDLSDAELIRLLKNHGTDRRTLMKVIGAGAGIAALSGTVAGKPGRGTRIDKVYGASYAADIHTVPSGLVDYSVDLHVHPGEADHPGFPLVDRDGDGVPAEEGPEAFFDPVGLHVKPGEIVKFTTHGDGLHTVTSFHPKFNEPPFLTFPDRVPTDHGFTSPPIAEDDSWLYRFTTKGVYDLLCLPHVPLGMVVRIVVFDPEEDDIEDETFDEPAPDPNAPLPPNAATVLNADELDPENIVSEGAVPWADLTL
jgi:plastocyanin